MKGLGLAVCFALLVSLGAWAAAEPGSSGAADQQVKGVGEKPLVQTTCPVMGGPIKKNVAVDYEGGKVYFCCPGRVATFNTTPQKYLPSLYKQIYPQEGQTHCPVTGKAVDPQVKTEYEGKSCDKEGEGCGGDGKGCDQGKTFCANGKCEDGCAKCKDGCTKGEDGCAKGESGCGKGDDGCCKRDDGCGKDKKCLKSVSKENAACCKRATSPQLQ